MKLNKLYNALVVGGGVLATGCTTTAVKSEAPPAAVNEAKTPANPIDKASVAPAKDKMDCSKVCEDTGGGVICPDPHLGGDATNCCWLMSSPRHPCCP
jgi:hypothetical protein